MANRDDYLTYLDHINGSSFDFIANLPNIVVSGGYVNFSSAPDTVTWYSARNVPPSTYAWTSSDFRYYNMPIKQSENNGIDRIDINYNTEEEKYYCHLQCYIVSPNKNFFTLIPGYGGSTQGDRWNIGYWLSPSNQWITGGGIHTNPVNGWDERTYYGTLEEVFQKIELEVKHCDIYVDGKCWSRVSPVTYAWQSVPSISGKKGVLSLPVLIDTDGEPVSSGSASDFSTLPSGAKVRTLADANI